jgi:hypothetical protein
MSGPKRLLPPGTEAAATNKEQAMAKQRKAWVFSPEKKSKSSLPGTVRDEVDTKHHGQQRQPMKKTCTKCKKEKMETDFALTRIRGRVLRRSWCDSCMKMYYKAYYLAKVNQ